MQTARYYIPTRHNVQSLKVGDLALSVFGWATVVSIFGDGDDINGKAFKCFYVETKKGLRVSSSYQEGRLCRTMEVTREHTSYECDRIERDMIAKGLDVVVGPYPVDEIQFS